MASGGAVRWEIEVSKKTDATFRSFLDSQGMSKREKAKFIEEAVLARVFRRTVEEIHARNRSADPAEIEAEIEAAIREVRAEARPGGRRRKA